MQRSLAALGAAGLPAWYAERSSPTTQADQAGRKDPASGIVGTGSPQSRRWGIYQARKGLRDQFRSSPCATWTAGTSISSTEQYKKEGYETKGYDDFRELCASKDVDAVIFAIPDHWHALVAIEALKARQGRVLREAADADGRGGAGRAEGRRRRPAACSRPAASSGPRWRQFRAGRRTGPRRAASARSRRSSAASAATRQSGPIKAVEPPKELDWDMWLGPTAEGAVPLRGRQEDELPLRVPLVVRVLRRQDDRLGRPPHRHRPVVPRHGRQRADRRSRCVEADKPYDKGDGYNCHPNFKVQYTYANGAEVIAMSRRRDRRPGRWSTKDGKPLTRRRKDKAGKVVDGDRGDENGVLFVGDDGHDLRQPRVPAGQRRQDPVRAAQGRPEALPDAGRRTTWATSSTASKTARAADLQRRGRRRVGDRLPHRGDRPADRQGAEVGPEGPPVHRRRRGATRCSPASTGSRGSWWCDSKGQVDWRAYGTRVDRTVRLVSPSRLSTRCARPGPP